MSRFLLVVLVSNDSSLSLDDIAPTNTNVPSLLYLQALFALSDVRVVMARLKNKNHNVPSRFTPSHPRVRKAHHSHRHLAEGNWKGKRINVLDMPDYEENLKELEVVEKQPKKKEDGVSE